MHLKLSFLFFRVSVDILKNYEKFVVLCKWLPTYLLS